MICPICSKESVLTDIDGLSLTCTNPSCAICRDPLRGDNLTSYIRKVSDLLSCHKAEDQGKIDYISGKSISESPCTGTLLESHWKSGWESEKDRWDCTKERKKKAELCDYYEDMIRHIRKRLTEFKGGFFKKKTAEWIDKMIKWMDGMLEEVDFDDEEKQIDIDINPDVQSEIDEVEEDMDEFFGKDPDE